MRYISYHLGLGDAIICAGLVNYLSKKEEVIIPCYVKNLVSVISIHIANPNVTIIAVKDDKEKQEFVDRHTNSIILNGDNFPKGFYEQAGIDWKERWDSCPVYESADLFGAIKGDKFDVFIHDDASRGFIIKQYGKRFRDSGKSILCYVFQLCMYHEIHCIDSSFLHLIECIPLEAFVNSPKFFYHKSARPNSTDYKDCLRHNWQVV